MGNSPQSMGTKEEHSGHPEFRRAHSLTIQQEFGED